MLIMIHGDDIAKSRKYFTDLKEKYPPTAEFDGQDLTITDLKQVIEGGELFSETKHLFIEQLLTGKKGSSNTAILIQYLLSHQDVGTVVIWEKKELERKTLTTLKNATVKLFKLPQSLFNLLDAIKPENGSTLVKLYHSTLETVEDEAIYYMFIRHIRMLLALHPDASKSEARISPPASHGDALRAGKSEINTNDQNINITNKTNYDNQDSNYSTIEEIKRMQDWQLTKMQKQAKLFSLQQLIDLYQQLYQIEVGLKTGTLPLPIRTSIDIFLSGL